MTTNKSSTPTLRDCVYGQAVGDALGVPYEFKPRGTFRCADMAGRGTHNQPAGTWSDDTSMALATCDTIRELDRVTRLASSLACRRARFAPAATSSTPSAPRSGASSTPRATPTA